MKIDFKEGIVLMDRAGRFLEVTDVERGGLRYHYIGEIEQHAIGKDLASMMFKLVKRHDLKTRTYLFGQRHFVFQLRREGFFPASHEEISKNIWFVGYLAGAPCRIRFSGPSSQLENYYEVIRDYTGESATGEFYMIDTAITTRNALSAYVTVRMPEHLNLELMRKDFPFLPFNNIKSGLQVSRIEFACKLLEMGFREDGNHLGGKILKATPLDYTERLVEGFMLGYNMRNKEKD